jgi:hypothetical protein
MKNNCGKGRKPVRVGEERKESVEEPILSKYLIYMYENVIMKHITLCN